MGLKASCYAFSRGEADPRAVRCSLYTHPVPLILTRTCIPSSDTHHQVKEAAASAVVEKKVEEKLAKAQASLPHI
eukprot:scaffold134990_cov36-Tisochrysis_lutea.AAC.3